MQLRMFSARKEEQVPDVVIGLVTVDVMHFFPRLKRAPEMLFHHIAVFMLSIVRPNDNANIPSLVEMPTTRPSGMVPTGDLRSVPDVLAGTATKPRFLDSGLDNTERSAAYLTAKGHALLNMALTVATSRRRPSALHRTVEVGVIGARYCEGDSAELANRSRGILAGHRALQSSDVVPWAVQPAPRRFCALNYTVTDGGRWP